MRSDIRIGTKLMVAISMVGILLAASCGKKGDGADGKQQKISQEVSDSNCDKLKPRIESYVKENPAEAAEKMGDAMVKMMKKGMDEKESEKEMFADFLEAAGFPSGCAEIYAKQEWEPDIESEEFEKEMAKQISKVFAAMMEEGMQDAFSELGEAMEEGMEGMEEGMEAMGDEMSKALGEALEEDETAFTDDDEELEEEIEPDESVAGDITLESCLDLVNEWTQNNPDDSQVLEDEYMPRIEALIEKFMKNSAGLAEDGQEIDPERFEELLSDDLAEMTDIVKSAAIALIQASDGPPECVDIMVEDLMNQMKSDLTSDGGEVSD